MFVIWLFNKKNKFLYNSLFKKSNSFSVIKRQAGKFSLGFFFAKIQSKCENTTG